MSSIPASGVDLPEGHEGVSSVVSSASLIEENITLDRRGSAKASVPFFALGALGLIVTIAGAFAIDNGVKHAMSAYHIGFTAVLGLTLGAMFWVMVMYLVNATWFGPVRRQFENILSMIGVCALLFIPVLIVELAGSGVLFEWLNPEITAGDVIYEHKSAFLNPAFFIVRAVVYFGIWGFLAYKLGSNSLEQDRTGDRWLTRKSRHMAGWGMPLFGLATAFAGFDWLMSLDYHFFSTMWGVYFFAGGAFSSIAMVVVITAVLRSGGKLQGVVSDEHAHDLGKLLFGFTVFWAYIAFSQYFLIWYSNIPEETAYFLARMKDWPILTATLVIGHFIVPFLILLPRPVKRNYRLLGLMGGLMLVLHILDMVWIIRPMTYLKTEASDPALGGVWLDIAGIVGVVGIYLGFLVRRIHSVPLVAFNDPRLDRGLHHKNYV